VAKPVTSEHAGRLELWVGRQDVAKSKQAPWPLARGGQADIFQPLPFGTDVRGRVVKAPLIYGNWLIGAIPRQGKTERDTKIRRQAAATPGSRCRAVESEHAALPYRLGQAAVILQHLGVGTVTRSGLGGSRHLMASAVMRPAITCARRWHAVTQPAACAGPREIVAALSHQWSGRPALTCGGAARVLRADTTRRGGLSGAETAVLVVLAAALAVKAAPVALAAIAELLHMVLILAAVVVGLGAVGLVGLLAWRWLRTRPDAARTVTQRAPASVRAAQPVPEPRPAVERAPEVHLHLHGITAEDVAAILRNQNQPPGGHEQRSGER
jgi:hypothetical protein